MGSITHATKKRLSNASTRKSTIAKNISAEYVAYQTKLANIVNAVQSLIKQVNTTGTVWGDVAKHQNTFAHALLSALPSNGSVRSHAKEVEELVSQLQRMVLEDEGENAPYKKLLTMLNTYLAQVEDVQTKYPEVEMSWTELSRYQRKVDKLSKKGQKKNMQLQRNVDKLSTARVDYDLKLNATLEKMREVYDKHEAIFQFAHHAYWIAQEKYSRAINDKTKAIRWESMAVKDHLVKIDMTGASEISPIPRVQMLPPPKPEVSEYPTVEPAHVQEAREQEGVIIMPTTPTPSDTSAKEEPYVVSVTEAAERQRATEHSIANIPPPPTEMPTPHNEKPPPVAEKTDMSVPYDVTAPAVATKVGKPVPHDVTTSVTFSEPVATA